MLEKNLELLHQIILNAPNYIFWKDRKFIYRGCNYNFAQIAEYNSPEEVIGKSDREMPWGRYSSEVYQKEDEAVLAGKKIQNKEVPMIMGQGQKKILSISKVPLYDKNGHVTGILGIYIDVTDQKEAQEREKQALAKEAEAKGKAEAEEQLREAIMILTGSIVHDLRTPIASMGMFGHALSRFIPILLKAYELAKEAELGVEHISPIHLEKLEEASGNIEKTSKEMNEFINTTLKTLSKTIAGNLDSEDLILCSMDKCIDQTLRRYPFTKEEQKLIHWNRKYDFQFMGNEILMIRILFNLIKNSLYQIEKNNRGEIFIETASDDKVNILRIKDTAGGATPEVVNELFKGYKTTKAEGTGIGLAFSKKTMKNFGGDIKCHSEYGNYIEFVLSFPKIPEDRKTESADSK